MSYFSSRVVLLTFLYFIQGLPYGLQARFLPVYLRTKGHSLTNLGLFKMLLAPWLCKALWAPLVDKYGNKQKWLLWSITGLMVTCAVTSMIPPDNILLLCLSIFSLNLFAATQDIAVDSIAVTILPPDELGKGNTAQVVGYKIGAIFGGGILVWFMDVLGWTGLFIALTLLYIEALLFVYLSPTLRVLKRLGARKEPTDFPIRGKEMGKQNLEAPADDIPVDIKPPKDIVQKSENLHRTEELKATRSDLSEKEDPTMPTSPSSHFTKDTQRENVSVLLKSALEFLETKDDLERNLELRHDLRVEELGAEQQKEIIKEIVDACPLLPHESSPEGLLKNEGRAQNTCLDKNKTDIDGEGEKEYDGRASKMTTLDEPEVEEEVSHGDKIDEDAEVNSLNEKLGNGHQTESSSGDKEKTSGGIAPETPETLEMGVKAEKGISHDTSHSGANGEEGPSLKMDRGFKLKSSGNDMNSSVEKLDLAENQEDDRSQQKVSDDGNTASVSVKALPGDMVMDGNTPQTQSDRSQKGTAGEISNLESSNPDPTANSLLGAPIEQELGYLEDDASEDRGSEIDDAVTEVESAEEEGSESAPLEGLNEELLDDNVFLQDGEEEARESDDEDSFTCPSVRVSGPFAFIWDVIMVPNTLWIMVYVIIYKLGEQGAVGMLPLFLVDHEVNTVDVTFWTGVIGQATSMLGSCLGGWILSHPVYKLPCRLLIYQLSLCRLLPLGLLLWVVLLWSGAVFPPTILYRAAIVAMNLLLLVSGMVTTATFTLMMECSQTAPRSVQATHYTFLSSMEVFGKLTFMSVCGALVDYFGYTTMYLSFVILSAAILPWLWRYPDILCEKKMS